MDTKTSGEFSSYARKRASLSTAGLVLWTMVVLAVSPPAWPRAWPLVVFHLILLLNTYFSIRTFVSLTPRGDWRQHGADVLLASCFLLLPTAFNRPLIFMLLCVVLFILATLKYVLLAPRVGWSRLLYRKIQIDIVGAAGCFAGVIGMLLGYIFLTSLVAVAVFSAANVYVLWVNPIYNLSDLRLAIEHSPPSSE